MEDLKTKINQLALQFGNIRQSLDVQGKKEKIINFEQQTAVSNFWQDTTAASSIMRQLDELKTEVKEIEDLENHIQTLVELAEIGEVAGVDKEVSTAQKRLDKLILKSFLSGEYDSRSAILAIHAGQGGTEAMDWASMLYRMYLHYAEKKGFSVETVDLTAGEEAGIKSVTFKLNGLYAYGYLKNEAGTHRLVRQSPFNADKLRQTSFALVEVLPELSQADLPQIKIKNEDLEWQFFRSSSQGGQNVQKVSTAVRLKHIPTGIVVSSQTQRFQEQNRKLAMDLLRAKLWLLEQEQQKSQVKKLKGEYKPASWGMQIRSYVLHPYKMVKDLRTEVESSDPDSVLAGELTEFIEAEIKLKS